MRILGLAGLMLVITGCVALPDLEQQKAVATRQQFGANYEFSITSFFEDAVVTGSPAEEMMAAYQPDARRYIRELITRPLESYPEGLEWLLMEKTCNLQDKPSEIEEVLAGAIASSLSVKPSFISRAAITERLRITDSAMIHAKAIAAQTNRDAVAVLYFKPILTRTNATIGEHNPLTSYTLSYDTQFSVRSVPGDELMYNSISKHTCADSRVGGTRRDPLDDYRNLADCERQMVGEIAEKFLTFIRETRSTRMQ